MKKILLFVIAILSITIFTPQAHAETKKLSDLSTKNVHYQSIMKVINQGLMRGFPDGTFRPNDSISRKQVAVIIDKEFPQLIMNPYKMDKYRNISLLVDISKKDSAYSSIKKLYESDLMDAYYNKVEKKSYFRPNAPITRSELALIISQAYEGNYDYFRKMEHNHERITRAQFASIIVKAQENMSEAHRQMYNLTIFKYVEPKDVPLPKGMTDVQALKKRQEAQFKEYLKTQRITVLKGWTSMYARDYQFSQYIQLYSERFNLTEKEFVEIINRLVETGEVFTGVIDELNEYRMYYDFQNGRLYKMEPGGV